MPEGDTIHRAAVRMRPVLAGRVRTRFEAHRLVGDRPRVGERIDDVEARGKHLLIHFAGGLTLRTHMKMTGSWHLYRDGERWRKGAHLARAVVGADSGWVTVCFQAPVVETYHRDLGEPAPLASLGPDLTTPDPDLDLAVSRAQLLDPATQVGDVLLDQRVASGIGNVYKSDVPWLHGINPFDDLDAVGLDRLRAMYQTSNRLLVANLGRSNRVTYRNGLAVYGRQGQPCPRCGAPVGIRRQGSMARSTYWCPACQPPCRPMPTREGVHGTVRGGRRANE